MLDMRYFKEETRYLEHAWEVFGDYFALIRSPRNHRSEFVHQARLILEFNDGLMFSKREGDVMYSKLSLPDLQLLFEHGLIHHFCIVPDNRKI